MKSAFDILDRYQWIPRELHNNIFLVLRNYSMLLANDHQSGAWNDHMEESCRFLSSVLDGEFDISLKMVDEPLKLLSEYSQLVGFGLLLRKQYLDHMKKMSFK